MYRVVFFDRQTPRGICLESIESMMMLSDAVSRGEMGGDIPEAVTFGPFTYERKSIEHPHGGLRDGFKAVLGRGGRKREIDIIAQKTCSGSKLTILGDCRDICGLKDAFTLMHSEMEIGPKKILNPRLVNIVAGHPFGGPVLAFGTRGYERRYIREFRFFPNGRVEGHHWPDRPMIVEKRIRAGGYLSAKEHVAYDGVTGELMGRA